MLVCISKPHFPKISKVEKSCLINSKPHSCVRVLVVLATYSSTSGCDGSKTLSHLDKYQFSGTVIFLSSLSLPFIKYLTQIPVLAPYDFISLCKRFISGKPEFPISQGASVGLGCQPSSITIYGGLANPRHISMSNFVSFIISS